ncbi:MAG: uroporphyrinogen-III synthase [Opitutales bacterium]|nr:uroporphyrinogen-III synthase [Opitutales bacterium]
MKKNQPLSGRRIVVTRNREAIGRLSGKLESLGAEVIGLPLIDVSEDLDSLRAEDVFKEFASYEWILFTSRNGVRYFFEAFLRIFSDIRSLGFIRIGAVGPGTADALKTYFLKPDLVPDESVAEGLVDALKAEQTVDNLKILVITGNQNRPVLIDSLEKAGAIVDPLRVYRTTSVDLSNDPTAADFRKQGADALVFASSSAVKNFGEQAQYLKLEKSARIPALCSLGPITSKTMKAAGIPVNVESGQPDANALADALVAYFKKQA